MIAAGANAFANATIHGITLQYPHGLQYLVFNYTDIANWTFNPNTSVIDFTPPPDREFYNISIYTTDTGGFKVFPGNTTIAGTISNVHLRDTGFNPQWIFCLDRGAVLLTQLFHRSPHLSAERRAEHPGLGGGNHFRCRNIQHNRCQE